MLHGIACRDVATHDQANDDGYSRMMMATRKFLEK